MNLIENVPTSHLDDKKKKRKHDEASDLNLDELDTHDKKRVEKDI